MVAGEITITTEYNAPLLHIRDSEGHQSALKFFSLVPGALHGKLLGSHTNGEILIDDFYVGGVFNSYELDIYWNGAWWCTATRWNVWPGYSVNTGEIAINPRSKCGSYNMPLLLISNPSTTLWCNTTLTDWIVEA